MRNWNDPPGSLRLAVWVIAVQSALLLVGTLNALGAVGFAISLLLAVFLWRGSRIAWLVAAVGAIGQLFGPLIGQPWWVPASAAAILLCLFAPVSRRFIWDGKPLPVGRAALSTEVDKLWWWLPARLTTWSEPRVVRRGLVRVAVLAIGLFLLDGAVALWHEGAGHGSALVAVIHETVFILSGLSQIALVGLLILAVFQFFSGDGSDGASERSNPS